MRRDDLIAKLKANADVIRSYGVGSLYLFGSHARDEATATSDVDLFIDRDPGKPYGFLEYTNLIFALEDLLGADVDVCRRSELHPDLRDNIEASAIRVF